MASYLKGKSYIEVFGLNKSELIKQKQRKAKIGIRFSEEHKRKLSLSKKGKSYEEIYGKEKGLRLREERKISRLGYKVPKEIKDKIRNSEKGKQVSFETRARLSVNHKGGHPFGYKVSEKVRKTLKEYREKHIFPKYDTSIEVKIQNFLKQIGVPFFTHQYMREINHSYQCDILIPSMNMVIECDGDYWHNYPLGKNIDKVRTAELLEKGFKVLRLWEREIKFMDLKTFKGILMNKCSGGG